MSQYVDKTPTNLNKLSLLSGYFSTLLLYKNMRSNLNYKLKNEKCKKKFILANDRNGFI